MREDVFIQMFRNLEACNVFCTKQFKDDIIALIDTDVNKFISTFYTDIQLENIEQYNKFEKLNLTSIQKQKIEYNNLYRYEYRRSNKNIRCIFVIEKDDKSKILLLAFSEDWSKNKGKDSYIFNINRAIKIYKEICK